MKGIFVAIGLLAMMYPILCKVKFETLHRVFRNKDIWIQILFSIVLNWIVAPLVMVCRLSLISTANLASRNISNIWKAGSSVGISS